MFGLFKKKPQRPSVSPFYDALFGDLPLQHWTPAHGSPAAPASRDRQRALPLLKELLADTSLESRQHLQAWHWLRELGVQPEAAEATQVWGIVLEVALAQGNDTLAVYRDRRVRFSSHTGRVIVWETRDPQVDVLIDPLLNAGQRVAEKLRVWTEPRHMPPTHDNVRINLLTPSGLRCVEGPFSALARDPMAGPVITSGAKLMGALIGRVS